MSNFYCGSNFLVPLSTALGLKIDQCNFLTCQLFGCGFGYLFSRYLTAEKVQPKYRHLIELFLGVLITLFCFGSQIWHLLVQSISVYILLKLLPLPTARYLVLIFVLLFLSVAHIARMYYDYGSYTLDITGPLMIQTQKLSSLAFNLMDGQLLKKGKKLKRDCHKQHALHHFPTVLEFFSYTFFFHGLMVGPFVFMSDYLQFITGKQDECLDDEYDIKNFKENKSQILSAWPEISFHLFSLICYSFLFFKIEPYFRPEILLSEEFNDYNFFKRYLYMSIVMFLFRQKYYIAWSMSSITNLFSGFGFSGFDANHKPVYKLVKSFYISQTEFGTSTKMMIDHWNVGTALWLRECIYDRVPHSFGTIAVFACSAIWHGYYPGYYLAFSFLALMTNAARYVRKFVRPTVIDLGMKSPYDVVTALASMFFLNFSIIPFTFLDINKGIQVWRSFYFVAPLACILMVGIGLNLEKRKLPDSTQYK